MTPSNFPSKEYQPLTLDTAVQLVKNLGYFAEDTPLQVSEIGDGNLNLVFRIVHPESQRSIIVKQALPYAKVVGESWPLTLERAFFESTFLRKAAQYVPDLVPKVHHFDPVLAITVMEDLSSHLILRQAMIDGNLYPKLAEHIGTFVAQIAFHTSDFYLHPFEKKQLVKNFINPELCKITEDLVFTDPFFDHDTNEFPAEILDAVKELWEDTDLKREVAILKFQFLTQAEALLHGDLHSGSIFVTSESTKVIDPEFAYYGPVGFDLGQFFANLILNYLSQEAHSENEQSKEKYRSYLIETIEQTWLHFTNQFTELWRSKGNEIFTKVPGTLETYLAKVWKDTIGFAGCEVIRRTIGLARVADLETINDDALQHQLKRTALAIGRDLIKKRSQIKQVNNLIDLFVSTH
jgi:5-methylthioribose kinase